MNAPAARAVVLAAGMGTRLKWLTRERPKALMDIAGEPAIVHVLRRLAAQGVDEVAVNAHHHAGQIVRALGDGARFGVRLAFSIERELLDSGGGARTAMARLSGGLDGSGGPVLVHNADILADIDIRALSARCPAGGCALALVPNPAHHPAGDFALDAAGMVRDAGEARLTFAGVSAWDPAVWRAWAAGRAFPLTDPIRACIAAGRCAGVVHRGFWFDIGRPRDWLRARRRLARMGGESC
ncbi:MAG: nucleotidyltransferase family protein [Mariprofundaceae bacterium]